MSHTRKMQSALSISNTPVSPLDPSNLPIVPYPLIHIEDVGKPKKKQRGRTQIMRTVMGLVKERWEVREEELEGVGRVEGGHIDSGINSLTGKER